MSKVVAGSLQIILLAVITGAELGGCAPRHQASTPAPGGLAPGTYAIQLCQGPCSVREHVIAEGHLVVERERYSVDQLPAAARNYYRRYTALMLLGVAEGAPNACFALERRNVIRERMRDAARLGSPWSNLIRVTAFPSCCFDHPMPATTSS
jgi:hypothetical protein